MITVILILFWTLFGLSSVSVNFSSTTMNLNVTEEEIIKAGEFRYGACVLFEGKKKSIQKINDFVKENENFAYVRVVNIETIFPNKFVIHLTEREELFAVETDGQVLICDREFRVLRILSEFVSTQNNAMLLKGLEFENEKVEVGDFLSVKQTAMLKFYSSMLSNNRSLNEQLGKFKQIELGINVDDFSGKEFHSLSLTTFQGRKFVVNNIDFAFTNKLQKMFATENSLFNQKVDENGNLLNSNNEKLFVKKNGKGEYVSSKEGEEGSVVLSYELLSRCAILVDNLTLDENVDRTETDLYYALIDLGSV